MRKGAIPVPYIIALILGIIVVGLLAYWFFVMGGRIPGITTEQWCNERKFSYCTEWQRLTPSFDSANRPSEWNSYAQGCLEIGVGEPTATECSRLLIGLKPLGAACSADEQCDSGYCYCEPDSCDSGYTSTEVLCSGYTCTRTCQDAYGNPGPSKTCSDRKCS